ncbi:MAG: hypothetical protein K2O41_06125 [Clostridia bacterium]|nr:hypothetical protein [Clostridia bacterium]
MAENTYQKNIERYKQKQREQCARYELIKPEQKGVVTFAQFLDTPKLETKHGKKRGRAQIIREGLQVENIFHYIDSNNVYRFAKINKDGGAKILKTYPFNSQDWDKRLVEIYLKSKESLSSKNNENIKLTVTNEEYQLINEFRKLDSAGKKLVQTTIESYLVALSKGSKDKATL